MTVATADGAKSAVPVILEIKSTQLPLLALFPKTDDLALLAGDLAARFGPDGESPGFFDNDGVVIDLAKLPMPSALDLVALVHLLRQYGLVAVAARGAEGEMAAPAVRAGLLCVSAEVAGIARATLAADPVLELTEEPPPVAVASATVQAFVPTLVIDKPLRSGQKAYARGGDLVVLAMVNQGAEVVADGNIHVYAPLRGKAMAGARGNTGARIFALNMEPELISIAGIYRTSEKPLPDAVRGKPAQIRLDGPEGDKLIFEPLNA